MEYDKIALMKGTKVSKSDIINIIVSHNTVKNCNVNEHSMKRICDVLESDKNVNVNIDDTGFCYSICTKKCDTSSIVSDIEFRVMVERDPANLYEPLIKDIINNFVFMSYDFKILKFMRSDPNDINSSNVGMIGIEYTHIDISDCPPVIATSELIDWISDNINKIYAELKPGEKIGVYWG